MLLSGEKELERRRFILLRDSDTREDHNLDERTDGETDIVAEGQANQENQGYPPCAQQLHSPTPIGVLRRRAG